MSEAQKLRDEYQKKLEDLQDKCEHENATSLPYMWAPGHIAGEVLVCNVCEKHLEYREYTCVDGNKYRRNTAVLPGS